MCIRDRVNMMQASAVPIDRGIANDSSRPFDVNIKCITGTIINPPPTPKRPAIVPVIMPTIAKIKNSAIIS